MGWYGLQSTDAIPRRYFAAIARALERLPASISRACAREAPFVAVSERNADSDELLAIGWRCRAVPSEVCLIFARYGKGGFRPRGLGEVDQRSLDLERLEREGVMATFLDPSTRSVLTFEQFFSPPKERQEDVAAIPPSLPNSRDAETIAGDMKRNLHRALRELYASPLVKGSPASVAPDSNPLPQTIYPPTDDRHYETYDQFAFLMGKHTNSMSFPDNNHRGVDDGLKITRTALLFCPGFDLFEVELHHRSGFVVASLNESEVPPIYLTATSRPIHERLISRGNLTINKTTVFQYVRFFCRFVHGNQSAFPIIERACQLKWRFETEAVQKQVGQQLFPVRILRELTISELMDNDIGHNIPMLAGKEPEEPIHSLAACVSFGRMLSLAWFMVFQNGEVAMAADWELVSELPVYPQMFTDKDNFVFVEDPRQ